jgi:hypothetical protein
MISDQIENELDSEEEMPAEEPALDDMGAEGEEGELGTDVGDLSIDVDQDGEFDEFDIMSNEPMGDEAAMGNEMGDEMPAEEMPAENPEEEYNEGYDEMGDEDLNLEAIIRELEGDLDEPISEEAPELDEPVMEGEHSEESEEDMNIDEIIESILREEDLDVTGDLEGSTDGDELAEAKAELEEAYSTVKQLKSIINEVNLLNAKLLYTNKLFRNFELTEGQKMKVIENFDRAGNTREVKLVFSTLAESFNRPSKKRVVKESYASKATATTAPKKETTQVLSEGFELANRWKKLAGLL